MSDQNYSSDEDAIPESYGNVLIEIMLSELMTAFGFPVILSCIIGHSALECIGIMFIVLEIFPLISILRIRMSAKSDWLMIWRMQNGNMVDFDWLKPECMMWLAAIQNRSALRNFPVMTVVFPAFWIMLGLIFKSVFLISIGIYFFPNAAYMTTQARDIYHTATACNTQLFWFTRIRSVISGTCFLMWCYMTCTGNSTP